MLIYLSDVESGGETVFGTRNNSLCSATWHHLADGEKKFGCSHCCDADFSGKIMVSPKKGRGVLFFNHDLLGDIDQLSSHAACPVKKGAKWIAQRWMRSVPYQRNTFPKDPKFDGLPAATSLPPTGPWNGHIRVLSDHGPRIYLLAGFLSPDECAHLLAIAKR